ncbi:retron Se72 family effector protein [Citrobacter freundii]|uniref:retron Se72 family effector protein n=1 Tax=Citrobacter freundii TaxID=546 RepID=UPI0015E99E0E|nr:retron Se72 family effector protein [Citrobacter freundii]EKT9309065.1 retron Se72 family effector protein [Citrobacter freundii]ELJ2051221.1 retron Se72 family effector protein [Citrobacter freundii]MBJ7587924.1 retron Se72 family effector protein [Citrobacter freundii]QMN56542.1 cold shock domain-containing protein [Citrobacter freundii]HCE8852501.1 retron Se72 family effector protein [Citrobacter freundii]
MIEEKNKFYGIVKTFDSFKGYGFITREKGKDVFFFYGEIIHEDRYLTPGDKVSFEIKMMDKGPRAFAIQKI